MKKLIAFILSVVSVVITAFALVGCTNNETLEDGEFYTVTQAYEKGYLTREQVMSIAYYNNNGCRGNEEIMVEDYQPLPKIPEELRKETDKAIINSFYNSQFWERYEEHFKKTDIFYEYFGTYDNAIALKVSVNGEAVSLPMWEEKIDGVIICYNNEKRILIFVNEKNNNENSGKFYSLQEAYEKKFLSERDLQYIVSDHNNRKSFVEVLTVQEESAIKETAVREALNEGKSPDDFSIWSYYGFYNGYYIVIVHDKKANASTNNIDEWINIGSSNIHYTSNDRISVWKKIKIHN